MLSAQTLQFPEGVEGASIDYRLHVQMLKHTDGRAVISAA